MQKRKKENDLKKDQVLVVCAVFYQKIKFHNQGQAQTQGQAQSQIQGNPYSILLFRKAAHLSQGDLWEFPGGKVEQGEEPRLALEREIKEELGVLIKVQKEIGESEFQLDSSRRICLRAYFCQLQAEEHLDPSLFSDHSEYKEVSLDDLNLLEVAPADRPLIPLIIKQLLMN